MGATRKQIRFIERLMEEREMMGEERFGSIYMSAAAQTVRYGQSDLLSKQQASNLINQLLECPKKPANYESLCDECETKPATHKIQFGKQRDSYKQWCDECFAKWQARDDEDEENA